MGQALNPSEYRILVEHSPVMLWRAGLDAKCDYFNETWLAFTGRSLEQELGDGWAEGVHADDFERCVAYYLDHFERREAFEMEYRLRRHDGVDRWIFDRGAPFYDDGGVFAGFIGSCVDVDDRRSAALAQQRHDQEQLTLARDFEKWILAIVSHDIRSPLNTIQLAGHFLQTAATTETTKRTAETLLRGVSRIEHIVGDLLDLAREREGLGLSIAPKTTDLRLVCRQIIDELEGIAVGRRITLECDDEASAGAWDEHRILQAVSNLTTNALQHGVPGSPVRLRITGDERRVAVEVQNDGAIPAELLPRIFEPFRSGRQQTNRGDGLGLGLFIVKAIAQAHGGGVEVESSNDSTMFRLVLPRQAPALGSAGPQT